MRTNLGQQVSQRRAECRLVAVLDRGLEDGVQLVELGGGLVIEAELSLAEDPDDHDLSPSRGSSCRPGRSETGSPAGWACCWAWFCGACWFGWPCCGGAYWGAYGPCSCCDC